MKREEIEAELLDWMRASPWQADDARFERLALALYRFQFEACEYYARFSRSFDKTPDVVESVEDVPPVPTGAFKEFDLCCFDPKKATKTFRTSGTSSERRGQLHLDTLAIYEASLLSSLRETFVDDLCGKRPTMRFLAPSADESPDSSLSHMFETLRVAEGGPDSAFDLHHGNLDLEALATSVGRAVRDDAPILLLGTSFAFVHFLDSIRAAPEDRSVNPWRLPVGSRVMETGGFKGRSREVPREILRADLARVFEIPENAVVNQYGMTELGSQFYDSTWLDPIGPRRKLTPPWTRVRFVDPVTNRDVAAGEVGLIVIHDLANTGSIAAIQTADLGRAVLDGRAKPIGFDVLGRLEGAEARGCSIATDVMLEATRGTERA